jgi:hypothetical protein
MSDDTTSPALQAVLDSTPEIEAEPVMTADDARIAVLRSVAEQLDASIAAAQADLEARFPAGSPATPESTNIARCAIATLELRDTLLLRAKVIEKDNRPRILRPERNLKVVRPS